MEVVWENVDGVNGMDVETRGVAGGWAGGRKMTR